MEIAGLFRKVPVIDAPSLRRRLEGGDSGDLVLLDVREPAEYARGHLPGAIHIPLSRLADRIGEIDPRRPVVTY